MKFLFCIYSILLFIWFANIGVVLIVTLVEQKLKKSSKLTPSKSIIKTYLPQPIHLTRDILTLRCNNLHNLYS